ncbi:MAG: hypothetical protein LBR47_05155, partial [Spirochaetaceae bacterium]|nr:hypothetical protein [Spirochaetaceae bacterium]
MQGKKIISAAVFVAGIFFITSGAALSAQGAGKQTISGKYVLYYGNSTADPVDTVTMLNSYYDAFNSIFHFNDQGPGFLYIVRICDTIQEFTAYLIEKTGKTPEQGGSTFLKYNRPEKSEVIFITGTPQADIARHLFVQYLYSYVKEPPAWLLGGFSLYAENFSWSKEHGFSPASKINPWLSQAKKLLASKETALSPQQIMNALKNDYPASALYPQAWLLISYFEATSHPILKRLLPECVAELRLRGNGTYTSADEKQNIEIFTSYIGKWSSWEALNEDFARYAAGLHTPSEILRSGMDSYSQSRYSDAATAFTEVLELEPANNTAAYYLGLI